MRSPGISNKWCLDQDACSACESGVTRVHMHLPLFDLKLTCCPSVEGPPTGGRWVPEVRELLQPARFTAEAGTIIGTDLANGEMVELKLHWHLVEFHQY